MAVAEASRLDWVRCHDRAQDKCNFEGSGDELLDIQELVHDDPALELRILMAIDEKQLGFAHQYFTSNRSQQCNCISNVSLMLQVSDQSAVYLYQIDR